MNKKRNIIVIIIIGACVYLHIYVEHEKLFANRCVYFIENELKVSFFTYFVFFFVL